MTQEQVDAILDRADRFARICDIVLTIAILAALSFDAWMFIEWLNLMEVK